MKPWDLAVTETWQVLTGQLFQQHSYDTYQREDQKQQPGKALAGYNKTEPVAIKCLGEERDIQISGRLIGGCLDVLQHLVGTKFDRVKEFNTRYGTDGIIWFFEACDLNVMGIQTALWQLRQAGWIDENCRGIIFGRPANPNSLWDTDLPTAYIQALDGLNIPVIYDLDIGHCPPCWTLISGSFATVTKHQNQAKISYQLK
jgi:muramoyltetrapeptide carboxypeptidase LdcA involved in peptidoglycan recycling